MLDYQAIGREPEDDGYFDLLCQMSPEEVEAEGRYWDAKWAEHWAWVDRQSPLRQYRMARRRLLISALEHRRRLRDPLFSDFDFLRDMWRTGLRRSQRRLAELRAARTFGAVGTS